MSPPSNNDEELEKVDGKEEDEDDDDDGVVLVWDGKLHVSHWQGLQDLKEEPRRQQQPRFTGLKEGGVNREGPTREYRVVRMRWVARRERDL